MELFGYIKANKLTSEYILRQDMPEKNQGTEITKDLYKNHKFEIYEKTGIKKVVLKDIFSINNGNIEVKDNTEQVEKEYKSWVEISNKTLEKQSNTLLGDYKSRTKLIDAIVSRTIEKDINGISIDFREVDSNNMVRFIIELAPKLREIGINTCIVLNDGMNKQDYIKIVDYIVE